MIGERYGHLLEKPLAVFAKKIFISPNTLTVTGFVITVFAAYVLAHNLFWGGMLLLAGAFFDLLDGTVARAHNKSTPFGAFLDSVLDRYSDAFLFLGLTWYFFSITSTEGMLLSLGSMIGALLVSYTRARAEGLGKDCKVGLMERPERIILLSIGAMTGWIIPVMWVMLVLTHLTVVQRIYHVWKKLQ